MKKIVVILLSIFMINSIVAMNNYEVFASSVSISMSVSSRSVTVGETITVTVTAPGMTSFASNVTFDSSIFQFVGGTDVNGSGGTVTGVPTPPVNSFSFKLKAISAGTSSIVTSKSVASDDSLIPFTVNAASASVTVSNQSSGGSSGGNNSSGQSSGASEPTESSNSYLSSLEASSGILSPTFSKDVFEYVLYVEKGITEVELSAVAENDKAEVSGSGKFYIGEDTSVKTVTVTAEDGSVSEYSLTYKVLEENQLLVNGEEYTLNSEQDPDVVPKGFEKDVSYYNDKEIPVFVSKDGEIILALMTNSEGIQSLYVFDVVEHVFEPAQTVIIDDVLYLVVGSNLDMIYSATGESGFILRDPTTDIFTPISNVAQNENNENKLEFASLIGTLFGGIYASAETVDSGETTDTPQTDANEGIMLINNGDEDNSVPVDDVAAPYSEILIDTIPYTVETADQYGLLPDGFEQATAMYGEDEITVYKSHDGLLSIVIVMDTKGNASLFMLDEEMQEIQPVSTTDVNGKKYIVISSGLQKLYEDNNESGFVIYDPAEEEIVDVPSNQNVTSASLGLLDYSTMIFVLFAIIIILLVVTIVLQIYNIKLKKRILNNIDSTDEDDVFIDIDVLPENDEEFTVNPSLDDSMESLSVDTIAEKVQVEDFEIEKKELEESISNINTAHMDSESEKPREISRKELNKIDE